MMTKVVFVEKKVSGQKIHTANTRLITSGMLHLPGASLSELLIKSNLCDV